MRKIKTILMTFAALFGAVQVWGATVECSTWAQVKAALEAGNDVKLTDEITQSDGTTAFITTTGGASVTLDLNGHTITQGTYDNTTAVYIVNTKGVVKLTIKDSIGGGAIVGNPSKETTSGSGGGGFYIGTSGSSLTLESGTLKNFRMKNGSLYGGCINVGTGASFTMNGGMIADCSASANGGAVCNAGTFTMNGGTISNCKALCNEANSIGGGGVYNNGGTFNMLGGAIVGCSAAYGTGSSAWNGGGGLCNNAGTSYIYGLISNCTARCGAGVGGRGGKINLYSGGEIVKNYCSSNGNDCDGSGVLISGCDFTMYGGRLCDNYGPSARGYVGIVAWDNTFTMYGGVISGNTTTSSVTKRQIAAHNGTVKIYGGVLEQEPTSANIKGGSGSVSVSSYQKVGTPYVVGTGVAQDANNKLTAGTYTFCPTNAEYVAAGVVDPDKVVATGSGTAYTLKATVPVECSTWAQAKANLGAGNSVKVTANFAQDSGQVAVSGDVTLDLNGHTITKYSSYWFIVVNAGAKLTLTDTSDAKTGTVMATGGHAANGGALVIFGEVVIEGGTYTGIRTSDCGGFAAVKADGILTMNGGTITSCSAGTDGGAVYSAGTFTMNGGKISGCEAKNACGGGVCMYGSSALLEMYDGEISGNYAKSTADKGDTGNGGGIFISSSATARVYGGKVSGNEATRWGGGIYLKSGSLTVYGGMIIGNKAVNYLGGGIEVEPTATTTIYGGVVTGNTDKQNKYPCLFAEAKNTTVHGGVFDRDPASTENVSLGTGCASSPIGSNYVVGKDIVSDANNKLIAGTYTFCPTNAEYVAAGVVDPDKVVVTGSGTAYTLKAVEICTNCITFSADKAFGIKMVLGQYLNPSAMPNLEYSTDQMKWSKFEYGKDHAAAQDGTTFKLHVRGTGNKNFGHANLKYAKRFALSDGSEATAIDCSGNIETLLDYQAVAAGNRPEQYGGTYALLFYEFAALNSAPTMPATELLGDACYGMFQGCTSLKTAPDLPSTTLGERCYIFMFQNCTSLTNAPALPATEITRECYAYMFRDCTSLKEAPALPATVATNSCYFSMFSGCTSLTTASAIEATVLEQGCCQNMFQNCTSLKTAPTLEATVLGQSCCQNMFYGCTSLTNAPVLGATALAQSSCQNMFYNCTSLTNAPKLSATELATSCYQGMFYGCSSLVDVPDFTVTKAATNSCYQMFYNCTALKAMPAVLPATTVADYCYYRMFYNCTSLTNAPGVLPAETLTPSCYRQMFYKCSSLTEAPKLPATTLATYCYNGMFYGCLSLTEAPKLPATTLAANCYSSMFSGCSSLTEAPALPATALEASCYSSMFYGCSSLTEAPALLATTLADSCYSSMFGGCSSLTEAPALEATTLKKSCYQSMFSSCTSLKATPALPATVLADSCYYNMFANCTSLTDIPALDVAVVTNACCRQMFSKCSSLVVNTTKPGKEWKIPKAAEIASTAELTGKYYWASNMFANTAGDVTTGAVIVPGTTYYVGATKTKDMGDGFALWQYGDEHWVKGAGALTAEKTAELASIGLRNMVISDGITSIDDYAFAKFYTLTNVTCASSVASVGKGAFSRCLGIEALTFEGAKPTLGEKAFTIRAGIIMEGGQPVVYPIPKVTYGGEEPTLYGKVKLEDSTSWQEVTAENKDSFHFFTYEPPK